MPRAVTAQLQLSRLHEGEDATPRRPDAWPTPGQWLHEFNNATPGERYRHAEFIVDVMQRAQRCVTEDHVGEIAYLRAEQRRRA